MPSLEPLPRVLVLDVNETMSDLSHLRKLIEEAGLPWTLVDLWFAHVLRDGFALATVEEEAPFAEIAAHGLKQLAPDLSDELVATFVRSFGQLPLHRDVAPGLRALARQGMPVVTLSNGSASVAEALLERDGLRDLVGQVLSVEGAGAWKPAPAAYQVALRACGLDDPADAALVAVHPWDLHGAKRAGLRTIWVNRHGAAYPTHFARPDLTVRSFEHLAQELG